MRCAEVRDGLADAGMNRAGAARLDAAVSGHLAGCRDCRAYADRLAATRQALRERHAGVTAPAGFSTRVVANLPDTTQMLGWAALRLLPAALLLLLALGGFGMLQPPSPTALLDEPSAELLLTSTALIAEPGRGER